MFLFLLSDVNMLIISELELEEVMKKVMMSIVVKVDVMVVNGKCLKNLNKVMEVFVEIVLDSLIKFLLNIIWIVVLLNIVIYKKVKIVGISNIFIMNFCRVWLWEICVINIFMKGD